MCTEHKSLVKAETDVQNDISLKYIVKSLIFCLVNRWETIFVDRCTFYISWKVRLCDFDKTRENISLNVSIL